MLAYSLIRCSCGSSIPSPTDTPPTSAAPRFAASMMPGPPPVTIVIPLRASRAARSRAWPYIGSSTWVRAEPKMLTAGPSRASESKPSITSPWMRSARHASVSRNDASAYGAERSSLRSSVGLLFSRRSSVIGARIVGACVGSIARRTQEVANGDGYRSGVRNAGRHGQRAVDQRAQRTELLLLFEGLHPRVQGRSRQISRSLVQARGDGGDERVRGVDTRHRARRRGT